MTRLLTAGPQRKGGGALRPVLDPTDGAESYFALTLQCLVRLCRVDCAVPMSLSFLNVNLSNGARLSFHYSYLGMYTGKGCT